VDFFFVLFALAWLVVGVATNGGGGGGEGLDGSGSGASDSSKISGTLLVSWFALWPMVFQPAIGILMAGALFSGGAGWFSRRSRENEEKE
jgi:LPXTG-motif cell wall-anchored protein